MARGPESGIQTSIVRALRDYDLLVFHNANGGLRSRTEAYAFKDMGTLAGVPDLTVIGRASAVFMLECKAKVQVRERGVDPFARFHSLSKSQKIVIPQMRERGIPVAVVDNVEDAVTCVEAMGAARAIRVAAVPRLVVGF